MILASLKNTERIALMDPKFKVFFDFVAENDLLTMEQGTYELDGESLFVINTEIDGKKAEDAVLEGHEKYIDIQLLLDGSEAFGWKAKEDATTISQAYDAEKDLVFYADEADEIINMQAGQFMVFFPEDLHAPGISEGSIRKVIAKVRVS